MSRKHYNRTINLQFVQTLFTRALIQIILGTPDPELRLLSNGFPGVKMQYKIYQITGYQRPQLTQTKQFFLDQTFLRSEKLQLLGAGKFQIEPCVQELSHH